MVFAAAVNQRAAITGLADRSVPAPAAPAFTVPSPMPFVNGPSSTQWAPVRGASVVRSRPGGDGAAIDRLPALTPEGTTNVVQVLDRHTHGRALWIKVRIPAIPDGAIGWVPRAALGSPRRVLTHLTVDRAKKTATLTWQGRVVFAAQVAVGAPGTPTPPGTFYIRNRLTTYSSDFYGPVAFGTSARSAVLTDWPAGGFVGIHGTNRPDLIPGNVSHGCIRLRNRDILRLEKLMPVGTPVTIT